MAGTWVFLRSSRWLGGIERQTLWHAIQLKHAGWQVAILCLYRGQGEHPLAVAARKAGLVGVTLQDPGPWHPRAWRGIATWLRKLRPDVVHTLDYRTDVWVALIPRRFYWQAETQGHTWPHWRMHGWNLLDVWALRRAYRVLPVSYAWETWLAARGVPPEKMEVVGNSRAILPPDPEPEPVSWSSSGPSSSGPHWVFAGRFSWEKGVDWLLAQWPAIRQQWPQAALWLLGAFPSPGDLDRRMAAMLQQPGVHVLGFQADIRPWLRAADGVVVPSRREAWGMTAFEALALGTPVIAARVGGLSEVCRGASHAHLFTPGDRDALLMALAAAWAPQAPRGRSVARAYLAQPRFDPNLRHEKILAGVQ